MFELSILLQLLSVGTGAFAWITALASIIRARKINLSKEKLLILTISLIAVSCYIVLHTWGLFILAAPYSALMLIYLLQQSVLMVSLALLHRFITKDALDLISLRKTIAKVESVLDRILSDK